MKKRYRVWGTQQCAEMAKKSAKMIYGSFLKQIKSLDMNGGEYLEVGAGSGILAAMIAEECQMRSKRYFGNWVGTQTPQSASKNR